MMFLVAVVCLTYMPYDLMLSATAPGKYYVTSTTPNVTDNNFYSADSGFNTALTLRTCTLYKDFEVGLVKDGTDQANAVLDSIFDEINQAFVSQSEEGLYLVKKNFNNKEEMDDYVKSKDYRE